MALENLNFDHEKSCKSIDSYQYYPACARIFKHHIMHVQDPQYVFVSILLPSHTLQVHSCKVMS